MSSGEAPSSTAFAICHAYEAGGAPSAIRAAILASANVRASRPVASSSDSRSADVGERTFRSPPEMPDSASYVSAATRAMPPHSGLARTLASTERGEISRGLGGGRWHGPPPLLVGEVDQG